MKKWLTVGLALAMLLCVCACGQYNPAVNSPEAEQSTNQESTAPLESESGETEPGYTVTLTHNGKVFTAAQDILAQWTDGYSYYTAPFENGVASTQYLDGDFRVTLSGLPEGYTYDPNIYTATTTNRDIEIELNRVEIPRGAGSDEYHCITLKKTGFYRAQFARAGQQIFFEFVPTSAGTYVIESLVDTAAQQFNPIMMVYIGSSQFKLFDHEQDGGGAENGYTKNFRYEMRVDDDEIGAVFTFAIKLDAKSDDFPQYVDFALQLDSTYNRQDTVSVMQIPTDMYALMFGHIKDLCAMTEKQFCDTVGMEEKAGTAVLETLRTLKFSSEEKDLAQSVQNLYTVMRESRYSAVEAYLRSIYNASGRYVGAETVQGGRNVFDGDMYKLNPETGVYHVYDQSKYAANGGYGPMLYVDMTVSCRFLDLPFPQIEYVGNKALTVASGTKNYKQFIEGFDALIIDPPSPDLGPYLCVSVCPCRTQGRCDGACLTSCAYCHADCRRVAAAQIHGLGYADVVNSDGRFPVTPEIKDFLQEYSISQLLFRDGNGWVEENPNIKVDAMEDDQWLFACGYYVTP
ncbi:MAG: hypothetical protein IJW70_07145 [Clostridia bacterium]|nr:hypothetical protein [Clostridia bacterium]